MPMPRPKKKRLGTLMGLCLRVLELFWDFDSFCYWAKVGSQKLFEVNFDLFSV